MLLAVFHRIYQEPERLRMTGAGQVPAAMGAWAATQEAGSPWHGRQVVSVSGDGAWDSTSPTSRPG